jgi:hypothetical protein
MDIGCVRETSGHGVWCQQFSAGISRGAFEPKNLAFKQNVRRKKRTPRFLGVLVKKVLSIYVFALCSFMIATCNGAEDLLAVMFLPFMSV